MIKHKRPSDLPSMNSQNYTQQQRQQNTRNSLDILTLDHSALSRAYNISVNSSSTSNRISPRRAKIDHGQNNQQSINYSETQQDQKPPELKSSEQQQDSLTSIRAYEIAGAVQPIKYHVESDLEGKNQQENSHIISSMLQDTSSMTTQKILKTAEDTSYVCKISVKKEKEI